MGKICDDNKMVIFDKKEVKTITHSDDVARLVNQKEILLKGTIPTW